MKLKLNGFVIWLIRVVGVTALTLLIMLVFPMPPGVQQVYYSARQSILNHVPRKLQKPVWFLMPREFGPGLTEHAVSKKSFGGGEGPPIVPPGMRGFLLRLKRTNVTDQIFPGGRVDVLAGSGKAAYTVLQNVLVISVGRIIKSNESMMNDNSFYLTLALKPAEAQRLSAAQSESQGDISLVLHPK